MKSTWPHGALLGKPIKRHQSETAVSFAKDAFLGGDQEYDDVLQQLRAWFENEWDGGGVVLGDWAEAAVVAVLLLGDDDED